jgi:hypothetical protein
MLPAGAVWVRHSLYKKSVMNKYIVHNNSKIIKPPD